jgi:hypothetical protein
MSVIRMPILRSPASISRIQRDFRACNDPLLWTGRKPAIVIDSFNCLLRTCFDQPDYDARKIPMKTARSSLQVRIPM